MLTKKEKKELVKLVSDRNEHLKGSRFWDALEYCITLLLMMVIAFSIRSVLFKPMRVKGSSMENTLQPGDYMAVEKLSYIAKPMERGDVVICYYPNNDEYTCVKRIIGLEGEPSCDPQKSPDTPDSPEGNTEGPGTASSEPLLPS